MRSFGRIFKFGVFFLKFSYEVGVFVMWKIHKQMFVFFRQYFREDEIRYLTAYLGWNLADFVVLFPNYVNLHHPKNEAKNGKFGRSCSKMFQCPTYTSPETNRKLPPQKQTSSKHWFSEAMLVLVRFIFSFPWVGRRFLGQLLTCLEAPKSVG